jgi:hypothetical protein
MLACAGQPTLGHVWSVTCSWHMIQVSEEFCWHSVQCAHALYTYVCVLRATCNLLQDLQAPAPRQCYSLLSPRSRRLKPSQCRPSCQHHCPAQSYRCSLHYCRRHRRLHHPRQQLQQQLQVRVSWLTTDAYECSWLRACHIDAFRHETKHDLVTTIVATCTQGQAVRHPLQWRAMHKQRPLLVAADARSATLESLIRSTVPVWLTGCQCRQRYRAMRKISSTVSYALQPW